MKNCTKNTAIALSQLSLFDSPKQVEQPYLLSNTKVTQPDPLQIGYIPDTDRTVPDKFCRLIHQESQIDIPGQFSHSEAQKILASKRRRTASMHLGWSALQITRDWDFSYFANGIPRCRDKLLLLLELINSRCGGEANG